jgi:hypothetical protein
LLVMRLDVRKLLIVGATPGGYRRIGVVPGGAFEGERLSGDVLDGGSDWQSVRSDGSTALDVRLVLRTRNEALITMTYKGVRHGSADVLDRIEKGEVVDPSSYYFRIKRRLQNIVGSTASSQSVSDTARLMVRFIASSKSCNERNRRGESAIRPVAPVLRILDFTLISVPFAKL